MYAMKTKRLRVAIFSMVFVFVSSVFCEELIDSVNNSTVSYDPETLRTRIFTFNGTIQSRGNNGFEFESGNDQDLNISDRNELLEQTDNYKIGNENVQFNPINISNGQKITFINDNQVGRGEKKRRRRKPRGQGPQVFAPGLYSPYAPYLQPPGVGTLPFYGHDTGDLYSPPKRQRPSLASEALSSVSEALISIALFDDRECVARLLCEAASGAPGSGTLQSIAGLQPLLTLLSAYRGISSNPLFVFGRAAFLGMSSKNNPAACRYAYPLCPTDPEQLVYYLNNHNGGFFRFFNAPQNSQQNINQFYNQLSQNYESQKKQFPQNNIRYNLPYQYYQPNQIENYTIQKYGTKYPYDHNKYGPLNKIRFKNNYDLEETNNIQKRIQNRPAKYLDDFEDSFSFEKVNDHNTKWSFPEENYIKPNNVRVGKGLKFPENSYFNNNNIKNVENKRDPRAFIFPDTRSVEYVDSSKYQELDLFTDNNYNYNSYNNLNSDIYKGHSNNYNEHSKDQSIRTIYVVRGNGDPNHPEIIKLRPGQTIY